VHALRGEQHPSTFPEPVSVLQQLGRPKWLLAPFSIGLVALLVGYLLLTHSGLSSGMVSIPAGDFWRGCSKGDKDCDTYEQPARKVTVAPFAIDKYEITVADYRKCVKAGKCSVQGFNVDERCNWGLNRDNNPINCVDWYQARAYCQWAGKRLPTEAEWEKAARAGSTTAYSFGNDPNQLKEYAWYAANSGGETHPVGQLKPNVWGLYDMLGNVYEWVQDLFAEDYYQHSPGQDPKGPLSGDGNVLRGGAWDSVPKQLRTEARLNYGPGTHYTDFGFRCAR